MSAASVLMVPMSIRYALQRPSRAAADAPELDPDQQAVVDHDGGPVLVLAGPGTGKTTTLVESVVDRVERRGVSPDQVLVLTFSRKAAEELRTRITARLGRTTHGAVAMTFHSFCYALVRRFSLADPGQDDPETPDGQLALPLGLGAVGPAESLSWRPPTLVSAPEQDVRIRELLLGSAPQVRVSRDVSTAVGWPRGLFPALRTRGMARELQAVLARARVLGLDPDQLAAIGRRDGQPAWVAAAEFFAGYLEVFDAQDLLDYGELVHRALLVARDPEHQAVLRDEFRYVVVDEYQDTDPAQVALLRALAGDGRDLLVVGDPDQSIYGFRGADVGGVLRFPHEFLRRDGRPAEVRALQSTRRFGPRILDAARSVGATLPVPAVGDAEEFARFRAPRSVDPRLRRRPRAGAAVQLAGGRGRADRRPAPPVPPRGRRALGRDGCAGALRPRVHPAAAPRARGGRGARRGGRRRGAAAVRARRAGPAPGVAGDRPAATGWSRAPRPTTTASSVATARRSYAPTRPRRCWCRRSAGSTLAPCAGSPGGCADVTATTTPTSGCRARRRS